MSDALPPYRYEGARALVALHERHLRSFLAAWRRADAAGLALPETDDPSYASRGALLAHVLRAARGYLTWTCDKLGLPDPGIEEAPGPDGAPERADAYLEHLLARWRPALAEVPMERFDEVYPARWGVAHSIESMLEHAVMHPIRHEYQLASLLAARRG